MSRERETDARGGSPLPDGDLGMDRREALRSGAAAVFLPVLAPKAAIAAKPSPNETAPRGKFFTATEWALVDGLSEIIIPSDDHSPGARAAEVTKEIDRRLTDVLPNTPEAQKWQRAWREGLRRVDALSREIHGVGFLQANSEQRIAVATRMAANERSPKKPEEQFFKELKTETVAAYYGTEIGLKQELGYLGNSYLEEFVGHDASLVPIKLRQVPALPKKRG